MCSQHYFNDSVIPLWTPHLLVSYPVISIQSRFVAVYEWRYFRKCQGLNLCRLCREILFIVTVPSTVTQPGLKDRSSTARNSEALLSAESCPRITTWWTNGKHSRSHRFLQYVKYVCLHVCLHACAYTDTRTTQTCQSMQITPLVLKGILSLDKLNFWADNGFMW